MGIAEWVFEQIEDVGRGIENAVKKQARKVDALLGCDDYENASAAKRTAGILGFDSYTNDNSKRDGKTISRPRKGDVVGVSRGAYEHYGIYVNSREVIHYTSKSSDVGDNRIMKTSFMRFLRDSDKYFVLQFPDQHGKPSKTHLKTFSSVMGSQLPVGTSIWKLLKEEKYKLYDPDKVVSRAQSKLGEDKYNLATNNCEHFAIWCKTGVSESHQVNNILDVLTRASVVR